MGTFITQIRHCAQVLVPATVNSCLAAVFDSKLNWPKRVSAVYWLFGTLFYPFLHISIMCSSSWLCTYTYKYPYHQWHINKCCQRCSKRTKLHRTTRRDHWYQQQSHELKIARCWRVSQPSKIWILQCLWEGHSCCEHLLWKSNCIWYWINIFSELQLGLRS